MIRHLRNAPVIVGLFLLTGSLQLAQAQGNPPEAHPAASPNASSSPSPGDKSKKVWTNDDMKSAGGVSVVGDSRNQKYTMTKPPDAATVAKYKTDLEKLQQQLDEANKSLQQYKDFEFGKPSDEGGQDTSHGYSRTPVTQQITKLQNKKKQLEQQIDDLYEAARKNGVESGQLK